MEITIRYRPWLYGLLRNRSFHIGPLRVVTGSGIWLFILKGVGELEIYHKWEGW